VQLPSALLMIQLRPLGFRMYVSKPFSLPARADLNIAYNYNSLEAG
jgi:hypothetical protein